MNTAYEPTQSSEIIARFPLWFQISGVAVFTGAAMLAARLIWEQTVWTWERGPQMLGFSLAHGSGAMLFLFPVLLVLWTVVAIVLTVRSVIKKRAVASTMWVALGLAFSLLGVLSLPEGFWERAFIGRMATSPRAGDLFVYAAYRGDLGTVRSFISHGVAVGAVDHGDRRTALHGAAVKGDTKMLRYLASMGANLNALDRHGDSPLELAASRGNEEAVKFLTERGAKRIQGDESQRYKASEEKVREDIEETNHREEPH